METVSGNVLQVWVETFQEAGEQILLTQGDQGGEIGQGRIREGSISRLGPCPVRATIKRLMSGWRKNLLPQAEMAPPMVVHGDLYRGGKYAQASV